MPVTLQQLESLIAAHSHAPCPPSTQPLSALSRRLSSEPETPEAVARLKSALAVISSDVSRGNGSLFDAQGAPLADYWLGVVWAIAGLGWASGEDLAREWSRPSPRFTETGFNSAWNTYAPSHPNPVRIGSLYKLARQLGWQEQQSQPSPSGARGYTLRTRNELLSAPSPRWRVKNLLPERGLAAIYGQSGSGKSFLTIDLAGCIADSSAWFGHRVSSAQVTYLILEGEAGLASRMNAWEAQNGGRQWNVSWLADPFRLTSEGDVENLIAVLPHGGVLFIDTLNRAAPTSDENASADMGQILEAMKKIERATSGLVVVIHHSGKDTSRGLRGHSSLHAALDAAIEVERTGDVRSWKVAKAKEGEDGTSYPFALVRHALGKDADGDDITSCAIDPQPSSPSLFARPQPSGKIQKAALATVRAALSTSTVLGACNSGPQTPCMKVDDAVAAVASTLATTQPSKRTNRARKLIDDLTTGPFLKSAIDASGVGWLW